MLGVHFHRVLLVSFAIAFASSPVIAQETTGRLEGHVVDDKGEPVPFVNVAANSPALQGARGTQTDTNGDFVFLALAVGDYQLNLTHLAFQPLVLESIHIQLGQTTILRTARLQKRVYELNEVVVLGQALINPRSTVLGENLSATDYQALPIERDYKSVATLLPHANTSTLGDPVNFAGATGLENRYFVDGVDVTDPYRGATATNLPYNFVQEVQVKTGGYEAEYRSSLGGTVNAVTYSGGNEMAGQVFGFYTGNGFSATPRNVPGTSDNGQSYAHYDLGFGIGGPIRKDRLWYYGAFNPNFSTEDVAIPGWGNYEDRSTIYSFAGKLTWRANNRNTFVLTSVGDPTVGRAVAPPAIAPVNVDPFLATIRRGGVAEIIEGRHMIGDDLFFHTSLSRSTRNENSTPESNRGQTELAYVDASGVASGGGPRTKNESSVTMAALHATWVQRNHEVKTGVEYRDTRLDFDTRSELLLQSTGSSYYYQLSSFKGHVGSRAPSVFLQHSWRPTERLVVNDGLRWDGQYWISSEGKVAQTILDQWQPRLGVTYQPGGLGTQKVYASFGRFYQDLTTAPLFWYYNTSSAFFSANFDHDPRVDPSGADTVGYSGGGIQPKLTGLEGQYFDEFTVGYERQLGAHFKIGMRGIQRMLRQGIEDGVDPVTFAIGISNPGLGVLSAFPKMTREYSAVEISCGGQVRQYLSLLASYVLSRNYGNYEGLFDSRLNNPYPNATGLYDVVEQMVNATGLLPNDRTHVLKVSGSFRVRPGVSLGMVNILESGAPVSEFGGTPYGRPYGAFIGQRGSHGRTPARWDTSLRVGYEPTFVPGERFHPRLTLDFLHVASQRKALRYDENHYFALDTSGNQTDLNPNYRIPIAFQAPMAIRLGVETAF